jgi:putative transposase
MALGVAFPDLERLANRPRPREARDGRQLASPRISPVLDVEKSPPHRTTATLGGCARADSKNGAGESAGGAHHASHGELLKLGVQVSQATVAKYIGRRSSPPSSQCWRTFLTNHAQQIAAADYFVVPTATCRLLFVLIILAHDRRRVVHVAVTPHPTAAWTAQQFREAFPWDQTPRYLIHDRDLTFQAVAPTAHAMGIEVVRTAPRSPWQNAYVERFIGSVRRECLDHVIVLTASGLRKILREYVVYYTHSRTHLSLDKDSPVPRALMSHGACVRAIPHVGGLHHHYERRAA